MSTRTAESSARYLQQIACTVPIGTRLPRNPELVFAVRLGGRMWWNHSLVNFAWHFLQIRDRLGGCSETDAGFGRRPACIRCVASVVKDPTSQSEIARISGESALRSAGGRPPRFLDTCFVSPQRIDLTSG